VMGAVLWSLAVLVLLAVVWTVVLSAARVRRLHRLHVRTDAARDGLESALARRAAAALAVSDVLDRAPRRAAGEREAAALRTVVAGARSVRALGPDREAAENLLGRALGEVDRTVLPPAVLDELVDAEQLLVLARRVHNDAVRDTLALRSRRLVRWLHLAGTAAMPAYFEIADPEPGVSTGAGSRMSPAATAGVTTTAPLRSAERPVAPPR
jgi:hypothetical protein